MADFFERLVMVVCVIAGWEFGGWFCTYMGW